MEALSRTLIGSLSPGRPLQQELSWYGEPVVELSAGLPAPITRLHLVILQLRSVDLAPRFDLQTIDNRLDYLAWCVVHGRREYGSLRELDSFWQALDEPAQLGATRWSAAVSGLMQLAVRERSDLGISPALESAEDQLALLNWFWHSGREELGCQEREMPAWQCELLVARQGGRLSLLQQFLLETRPDLVEQFDVGSQEGRERFDAWWLLNAAGELPPSLSHLAGAMEADQVVEELSSGLPVPITRLHQAVMAQRHDDLGERFPLDSLDGRLDLLAWSAVHGRREYPLFDQLSGFQQSLEQPVTELPVSRWTGGISQRMVLLLRLHRESGIESPPMSEEQQLALHHWYWHCGWRAGGQDSLTLPAWQLEWFASHSRHGLTMLQWFVHATRPDVAEEFDLEQADGREMFGQWWLLHGKTALPEPLRPLFDQQAQASEAAESAEHVAALSLVASRPVECPPFGVNLIGYVYGQLGIGEDVRMAAYSLQAAGIPFLLLDFPPGQSTGQGDRSAEEWVAERPFYPVNIVCLTALEHLRLYAERGSEWLAGRYNIGYWPWELAEWPPDWRHIYHLVDEVWASSNHTLRAVDEWAGVPVVHMPMAVNLPEVADLRRIDFGLPDGVTLFVFSFDGNSTLARKNPLAVVRAFQRAFGRGDEPVGLVIKCMNPDRSTYAWRTVRQAAKSDARIHIINRIMEKPEVLALYRCCDCFVSLHRAEGYGRGLAEALLLGLDLITTDYSGSVDFCNGPWATTIPYRLVPVKPGVYFGCDGQLWAEADVGSAARSMREVVEKRGRGVERKVDGTLQRRFSPAVVGERYAKRLATIAEVCR